MKTFPRRRRLAKKYFVTQISQVKRVKVGVGILPLDKKIGAIMIRDQKPETPKLPALPQTP